MAPCALRATLSPTQAHIVIHVFCATLSSGGYIRPYNVSIGAISAILVNFFHKAKLHFLQKEPFPSTESAETLCVDSQTLSKYGPKSRQIAIFGFKNFVIFGGGHMLTCHVELSSPTAPYNRLPAMVYS